MFNLHVSILYINHSFICHDDMLVFNHVSDIHLSYTEPTQYLFGFLELSHITGEKLLHEGWISYDNLSRILVITVTEFVGKYLHILQKHSF
jgi:hypothetical protein